MKLKHKHLKNVEINTSFGSFDIDAEGHLDVPDKEASTLVDAVKAISVAEAVKPTVKKVTTKKEVEVEAEAEAEAKPKAKTTTKASTTKTTTTAKKATSKKDTATKATEG